MNDRNSPTKQRRNVSAGTFLLALGLIIVGLIVIAARFSGPMLDAFYVRSKDAYKGTVDELDRQNKQEREPAHSPQKAKP